MSAFDDFPPATHLTLPQWERHKAMLEEIDRLRLEADNMRNMRNMLADSIVVHHDDQAEICKLQAQVEVLEVVIARLRRICDADTGKVRSPLFCDATHLDTECAGWLWCCSLIAGHLGPHLCAGAAW